MENILQSIISEKITEQSWKQWLAGDVNVEEKIGGQKQDHNNLHREMAVNHFVGQFVDSLHLSFDWLIKQSNNIPVNRPKPPTNSFVDENKILLNFNDHLSFPSLDEADKSQKQQVNNSLKKRIKPTLVSQNRVPLQENTSFKNVNCDKDKAKNADYFKEEREMLKNFKMNIASSTSNVDSQQKTKATDVKKYTPIEPKFDMISNNQEIVKLKNLYVYLLLNNHILNFLDEIKFILEIINKKTMLEIASKALDQNPSLLIEKIFTTYHNCFYFVYLVFEEVFINNLFINFLDFKALNNIFSNVYLLDFKKDPNSPNLKEQIEQTYLGSYSDCVQKSLNNNNFVYFQPDTDSKSNFPNDFSFSIFRKQRDEFYRIFKNYHDNSWASSVSTDRKVQGIFVSNIRTMLNMSKDVGNNYHLSRLFVLQLIKSCHNDCAESDVTRKLSNSSTRNNSNQTNRPLNDQDRFRKLQDRFVKKTPHTSDLQASSNLMDESFASRERFFRDFIYYSDSHSFNEQLKLILKSQIIDLTTSDIYSLGGDGSIDDSCESDKNFLAHLARLNLLAKFLGFVCFYPLDTSINTDKMVEKKEFMAQQSALRLTSGPQTPLLDIETYLVNSMEKHILVVAVPWVVEFLLFVDQITLSMAYYENVISLLCLIYKCYLPNLSALTQQLNSQVSYTRLFIQLYLEKLFSLKKFAASVRLQMMGENMANQPGGEVANQMFHQVRSLVCVDEMYLDFHNEIFDFEMIASFFPHFSKLIVDQFKQFSNEVRKITPTCVSNNKQLAVRNTVFSAANLNPGSVIQTEAEECFLNIHSTSLRKCIRFLNERISATCNKRIKCDIYPKTKAIQFEEFFRTNPEFKNEAAALELNKNLDLTAKLGDSVRRELKAFVPEYSTTEINTIFPLIVVDDLDESVVEFAKKICRRHIEHRCSNWIELNLSNDTIYSELIAYTRNQDTVGTGKTPPIDSPVQLNVAETYQDFERVFYTLRETLNDALQRKFNKLTTGQIVQLLTDLSSVRTVTFLPASNAKLFDSTSLDLSICIVAFQPQMMNDELLDAFLNFWTEQKASFPRVLCAKNLHLVNQTSTRITTWVKLEILLKRLLRASLTTFADIEENTFALLKQEWPHNVLASLASLLGALVEDARLNKQFAFDEQNSHEILEWLSWFCSQNDD